VTIEPKVLDVGGLSEKPSGQFLGLSVMSH
jgi:hypothetical protein